MQNGLQQCNSSWEVFHSKTHHLEILPILHSQQGQFLNCLLYFPRQNPVSVQELQPDHRYSKRQSAPIKLKILHVHSRNHKLNRVKVQIQSTHNRLKHKESKQKGNVIIHGRNINSLKNSEPLVNWLWLTHYQEYDKESKLHEWSPFLNWWWGWVCVWRYYWKVASIREWERKSEGFTLWQLKYHPNFVI